jgi:hypothetical protein
MKDRLTSPSCPCVRQCVPPNNVNHWTDFMKLHMKTMPLKVHSTSAAIVNVDLVVVRTSDVRHVDYIMKSWNRAWKYIFARNVTFVKVCFCWTKTRWTLHQTCIKFCIWWWLTNEPLLCLGMEIDRNIPIHYVWTFLSVHTATLRNFDTVRCFKTFKAVAMRSLLGENKQQLDH